MNCDYVLVLKSEGFVEDTFKFDASTPEEALETARLRTKQKQKEKVNEFPFAPPIVKGTLYRELAEIDGGEFLTPKIERPEAQLHKFE